MATTQLLSLVISAIDKATAPIKGIQGALDGMSRTVREASNASAGLSGAITTGMLQAQAAIAITQQGFGALQGAIAKSSSLQLENMTTAQTFSALTGTGFDQATEFVDRLNQSLAISAAALPGTTEDYTRLARSITDNVLPAFQDASGKLKDLTGFEGSLKSITESFGVLSAASGVDVGNTSLGLTKALGGASVAELRQISVFEQNPQILNAIQKRLDQVGAKTLRDLDVASRVALIKTVGEKFVTGDFKTRASDTVDGLIQSFKSTLFDPSTGIFGLSRDIDLKQAGQQSAFTSFNKLLKNLIGTDGLASRLQNLLSTMGLTIDPMAALRDGFEWLNGWTLRISDGLKSLKAQLGGFKFGDIDFASIDIGKFLNDRLGNIGETLGGWANTAFDKIGEFLEGVDWNAVGTAIFDASKFLAGQIGSFLKKLSPQSYVKIAGALLAASAVGAIATFAAGLGVTFLAATAGAPVLLAVAAVAAIAALGKAIYDNWDGIMSQINQFFSAIGRILSAVAEIGIGIVTLDGDKIKKGIKSLFGAIGDVIQGFLDQIAILTNQKTSGQVRADNAEQASYQKQYSAGDGSGLTQTVKGYQPRWMGQIPTAADGLFGAIASEMSRAPRNSSPVIANTSEFILRPDQIRNLVQGTAAIGSSGGNTFNLSFNVSNPDPETAARETLRYFEVFYQEHIQGQLA